MSPLLAQSGHADTLNRCPLSEVKRTSRKIPRMSASDPKRTLPTHVIVFRWTYPVLIVAVVVAFPTYFFIRGLFEPDRPALRPPAVARLP
jgi:hypothetical protein